MDLEHQGRADPGARGCLPGLRFGRVPAPPSAPGAPAADPPPVAGASAAGARSASAAMVSADGSGVAAAGAVAADGQTRSQGARLLGGRELLVGFYCNRSRASFRSDSNVDDRVRNASSGNRRRASSSSCCRSCWLSLMSGVA